MKIQVLILSIGVCLLSACSGGYEQVPIDAIDQAELVKAEALALKILQGCETGAFPTLTTAEATLTIIDGLTEARQQEACNFLRGKYGTFKELTIGEVLQTAETADFRIYRFKGTFQDTDELAEVRVTFDKNGKMSGLWTMPWIDRL